MAHYQATGKRTPAGRGPSDRGAAGPDLRAGQAVDLARAPDHRDGSRQALPGHRRRALPGAGEVPAGRAGPGRHEGGGPRVQPVAPRRWSSRARRSATRCAPPTCTRAWPTWPRSPGSRPTSTPWTASGRTWSSASSTSPAASGRPAPGRRSASSYELPNMSAYNETCAAIGNDFWNHRLFLLHADARYIDVMERTLYNGLLSGRLPRRQVVLLPEPARVGRPAPAQPLVRRRLLPRQRDPLHGLGPRLRLRQAGRHGLREPLRGEHAPRSSMDGGRKVRLVQETRYPWDGAVRITVSPDREDPLRAPRPDPGVGPRRAGAERPLSLRSMRLSEEVALRVNGQPVPLTLEKGFARSSGAGRRAT